MSGGAAIANAPTIGEEARHGEPDQNEVVTVWALDGYGLRTSFYGEH